MLNKEKLYQYLTGKGSYIVTLFQYIWLVPSIIATRPISSIWFDEKPIPWQTFHTVCLIITFILLAIYIGMQKLIHGYKNNQGES